MTAIEPALARVARPVSIALGALLWLSATGLVEAQVRVDNREELAFDRPESWAMKYFSSVSLPTGLGGPRELEAGSIDLGLEAGWVPSLDEEERTVGFFGTKTEDLNKTSIFGRPRATFGLPRRFSLTLGYVPPIEVNGVEPNLLAVAIGRPLLTRGNKRLGLALAAQDGTMKGDFTCSAAEAAAGDDRTRNPFGCEAPSRDELDVRTLTLELTGAATIGRFEPYLAISWTSMDLEFQLDALYSGIVDTTRQTTDGSTVSLAVGTGIELSGRSRAAIEMYYTELEVQRRLGAPSRSENLFNVRALVSYRVR